MEPEDACGGGCVTLGSGTALLRGAGLGLEALYPEKHSASLLPKVGGENPAKTTCRGIASFSPLQEEGRTPCQAQPRGARPRVPEVLC